MANRSVRDLKNLIVRKTIHAVMALSLAAPAVILPKLPETLFLFHRPSPAEVYGLLMIAAAWINALRVKGPAIEVTPEELERILQKTPGGQSVDAVVKWLDSKIRQLEREYERRAGWVGLMYGVIGVGVSYFLFGWNFLWGVAALATTDVASAVVGAYAGRLRMPFASTSTVEGTVAGFFAILPVALAFRDPVSAALLSAAAALSEAYGVEDNLEVPFVVSGLAWLMPHLGVGVP